MLPLVPREGHVDVEKDRVGGVAHRLAGRAGELLHALQRAVGSDEVCHVHACEDACGAGIGRGGEIGVGVDVDEADAHGRGPRVSVLPEGG